MKKYLIAFAALFMLGACDNTKPITLACGDHVVKVFMESGGERITAIVDDRFSVKADKMKVASGAMYAGEVIWGDRGDLTYIWQLILWNKDNNWLMHIDTGFDLVCEVVK